MTTVTRSRTAVVGFAAIYLLYAEVALLIEFDTVRPPAFWSMVRAGAVLLLIPTVYVVYKRTQQLLSANFGGQKPNDDTTSLTPDREAPDSYPTEVTTTGIVCRRNENGYIIHPDRHDTGEFDRLPGVVALLSGILLPVFAGVGGVGVTVMLPLLGLVLFYRSWTKRKRAGGYRAIRWK